MKGTMVTIGRIIGRTLAIAGVLVLFMGVVHSEVSAETKVKGKVHSSLTANEYADICDDAGASDIKVSKNNKGQTVVTCKWSDGFTSKCNFSTKECIDTIPRRVGQDGQEYVEVSSLRDGIQPDTNDGSAGTGGRGKPEIRAVAGGIAVGPATEEPE